MAIESGSLEIGTDTSLKAKEAGGPDIVGGVLGLVNVAEVAGIGLQAAAEMADMVLAPVIDSFPLREHVMSAPPVRGMH